MKVITGKIMEEKLKHGYTTAYLASYFETSEEEFLANLEKTFSARAYRGYMARLKKNDKSQKKSESSHSGKEILETAQICSVTLEEKMEEPATLCKIVDSTVKLNDLILEKENLEKTLNEFELQHKALYSQRIQIKHSISCFRDKLEELKQEIVNCKSNLSELLSELDSKLDAMHELNNCISETKSKINEVDIKIDNLKRISILVYNSGDIEFESEKEIVIPDWNELFNNILSDEKSEDYTVKQLRTLSKVIAITQKLDKENTKYDIVFEDSKLEKFFFDKK